MVKVKNRRSAESEMVSRSVVQLATDLSKYDSFPLRCSMHIWRWPARLEVFVFYRFAYQVRIRTFRRDCLLMLEMNVANVMRSGFVHDM